MGSQSWGDINEQVRDKATKTLFGHMESVQDVERVGKALKWSPNFVRFVSNLPKGEFVLKGQEAEGRSYKILMPSHMHKEVKYKFIEMYRKYYPEKMKRYAELVKEFNVFMEEQRNRVKEDVEEEAEKKKREIQEKLKTVEEKDKTVEELEKAKEKLSETQSKEKERIKGEAFRLFSEGKLPNGKKASLRAIGEYLKIDHKTAKNYINELVERKQGKK